MFVNWLIVLFVISCVTWISVSWFALQIATETKDSNFACSDEGSSQLKRSCFWYAFTLSVNVVSFNVATWLFVMRYWLLSHILKHMMQKRTTDDKMFTFKTVMWLGVFLNITLSLTYVILSYFNIWSEGLFSVMTVLYITSTFFMYDGLKRIKTVMLQVPN